MVAMLLLASQVCLSQVDDWDSFKKQSDDGFASFRKRTEQEFESFRQQINAEYARFMAEKWEPFDSFMGEDIPWHPEPPKPVFVNPKQRPSSDPIPFVKALPPKPLKRPEPVEPIVPKTKPVSPTTQVYLYGTVFGFHIDKAHQLTLQDVNEQSVAHLWSDMANPYYDNLVAECLQYRDEKNLCDWAYISLTKVLSEKCCGKSTNEAVELQMYFLTQSGYQVRLARANGRLAILIGSEERIYRYKYFVIDDVKFYNMDLSLNDYPFYVFNHSFPKERSLSLALSQPKFNVEETDARIVASKRHPDVKATIETNKNLIDFYNTYPLSSQWQYYSAASLSNTLKEGLYPMLKAKLKGKTESEAANILINFVQTGFQYATDDEQFGYERPLFPDETFYYPFSDCEDRAILYSCLVRELLGLDVVLLHYPGHLASAVHFNEKIDGDYLIVDGVKFIICDPTYIGAPIGMCMPDFKQVQANVVSFK